MDLTPGFLLHKIPIGKSVKALVEFLTDNFDRQFRIFSDALEWVIVGTVDLLALIPPLVVIATICLISYMIHRKWKLTLGMAAALLLILNLGYWQETLETGALVIYSTLVSILLGVPLGITAAHRPWLFQLLRPILDLMQTIPTFVYLIPTLMLFKEGEVEATKVGAVSKSQLTAFIDSNL